MAEFVKMAQAGDLGFQRLLEDAGEAAGRGLATVGTILNPGLFVISGGMATAGEGEHRWLAGDLAPALRDCLCWRSKGPGLTVSAGGSIGAR
jgi:predicted NBD/HSP70 family sugar kinase